jgi:hypothetical protein
MSVHDAALVPFNEITNAELLRRIEKLDKEVLELRGIVKGQADALRMVLSAVLRRMADELSAGDVAAAPAAGGAWDMWKSRVTPRAKQVIEVLLAQREATAKQLCAALKCDPRTLAKGPIYELNRAGLLSKNGGMYSLKPL